MRSMSLVGIWSMKTHFETFIRAKKLGAWIFCSYSTWEIKKKWNANPSTCTWNVGYGCVQFVLKHPSADRKFCFLPAPWMGQTLPPLHESCWVSRFKSNVVLRDHLVRSCNVFEQMTVSKLLQIVPKFQWLCSQYSTRIRENAQTFYVAIQFSKRFFE